jgi:predicted transcriptional regulator
MDMLWIISIVMAISGVLGGIINFFISDPVGERPLTWWQHILVGLGAAFMVPLFLNMISSGLIDAIRGTSGQMPDFSKLFVLAGFCLVAAVSSRAFIRTLSERVLQEARTAKKIAEEGQEQAAEARSIVAPLVEEEPPSEVITSSIPDRTVETGLSDNERSILNAMTRPPFTMRSLSGLAKETDLEKAKVNDIISGLVEKGLAAQWDSSSGKRRWYATSKGRSILTKG